MLISIVVLAFLILAVTQVVNTAATVVRPANKHIDTDTQARAVFDRMALDFGRMLKRTDIDYFLKQNDPAKYPGHSAGHSQGHKGTPGQQLNDQMAFFTQVPGYYPSGAQSPISLVAYRVNNNSSSNNPSYFKLERMGKGLLWNGVSNFTNLNSPNTVYPIVFLPQKIYDIATAGKMWSAVVTNNNSTNSNDPDYETIGPGVFRFEYYYLLKTGKLAGTPWNDDPTLVPPHTIANFFTDVEAIAVVIAVVDPASRSLLSNQNLTDIASDMTDWRDQRGRGPVRTGVIEANWQQVVIDDVSAGLIPPAAVQAIRIYSRYFDLKTL
jgi:hypothetical protein